jgi:hypothetical protein
MGAGNKKALRERKASCERGEARIASPEWGLATKKPSVEGRLLVSVERLE